MLGQNHHGYLVVLGQLWAVLVGTSRNLVSKGRCSLVFGGLDSVLGGTGWYLLVLGQHWAVFAGICWYWVSISWYYSVLDGRGLI